MRNLTSEFTAHFIWEWFARHRENGSVDNCDEEHQCSNKIVIARVEAEHNKTNYYNDTWTCIKSFPYSGGRKNKTKAIGKFASDHQDGKRNERLPEDKIRDRTHVDE